MRTLLVDIRPQQDYAKGHVRAARSIPLSATDVSFSGDARAVEERWREISSAINGPVWPEIPTEPPHQLLIMCGDSGQSGRMAVAILRAKGVDAFSIEGGYDALVF